MTQDPTQLSWLLPPPDDFRAQCKALATGHDVQALAIHALDVTQLSQLAKAMRRLETVAPLQPFRLTVLSSATADFLVDPLLATGARHGLAIETTLPPFGQIVQQAFDPGSETRSGHSDAILLLLDHHFLFGMFAELPLGDVTAMQEKIAEAVQQITAMRDHLRQTRAAVIVTTVPLPAGALFGHLDRRVAGTERAFIHGFNLALVDSLTGAPDLLLDLAGLSETVGLANWHDAPQWLLAKLPFASQCIPLFAEHVARLLASLRGLSRKCLVLDLDNTIWGGIIGDDGLEGIKIGQGSAVGEAHLEIQRLALRLRARGIVLAVSSKNEDAVARQPFRAHPDMLLREDHIAVFQANWNDKASNLAAIAETLNIGRDALVFLDDNPAERALVRQALPEVAVPELPRDPAYYAEILLQAGYFEAVGFAVEDMQRAEQYQDNAKRAQLSASATDLPAYLKSLDMEITFAPFDAVGRARIAQLINKSNQFNLTTRRYTEAQIDELAGDATVFTRQVRLKDSFGDNGMISTVICRTTDADAWEIDTWLMSCRVLKRNVEQAVLNEIVIAAAAQGIARIVGRYIPTEKNMLVKDHYRQLGFDLLEETAGQTNWTLAVASYQPFDVPMRITRLGVLDANAA